MSDAVAGDPVVGAPNQIVCVVAVHDDYRLAGSWSGMTQANAFLAHLGSRAFSPATVRAYAYDVVNSARFLIECGLSLEGVVPTDIFDWVDWQSVRRPGREKVVPISRRRGSAPASVNRRAAAVRALFEYSVMAGAREDNPVPTPHRGARLATQSPRCSGTSRAGASPPGWAPGPPAASVTRVPRLGGRSSLLGRSWHLSGPSHRAVDGFRWPARRRGPITAPGRCRLPFSNFAIRSRRSPQGSAAPASSRP